MKQQFGSRFFAPAFAAALFAVIGCGGYGEHAPVQGKVMVDGAPLENGTITFTPTAAGPKTVGGAVKDGKYSIPADQGPAPGSYRVTVLARKKTGRQVGTPGDPEVKMDEVVDMQTTGSNLSAEIKDQSNTLDFTDLKSAGPAGAPSAGGGQVKAVGD